MVLRNSGRVGSRRFFSEGSPCNPEYGGKGISVFRGIGRNWGGEERGEMGEWRGEKCYAARQRSLLLTSQFSHLPFLNSPFSFLFDYSFALIEQFSSCFPFFYKIDFRTFGKNLIEAIDIII